ncbi:cyclin-domain-containing protein [Chlamydoabsidia padenii]|nr:cyclin-domain-containing protein [Chlamydoabsidia padenii]
MESLPTLHFDLSLHPTKDTIKLISSLLEKVISVNDNSGNSTTSNNTSDSASTSIKDDQQQTSINNNDDSHRSSRRLSSTNIYTCFHARSIPSISIQAYLTRILKYCPCANECFLAVLVYFDRMTKADPPARTLPLRVNSYNVHRLIIAGIMIASKLFSDVFFTNTRYAKVGGLPVSELNVLEVEFLALNEYNMFVTIDEFQYYGDQLLFHWMKEHGDGQVMKNKSITDKDGDIGMTIDNKPYDTTQINRATRQLSIDKTNGSTTPMKDIHRKSDEIDQHRLFKRPSSRTVGNNDQVNSIYMAHPPAPASAPPNEHKQ